MANPLPFPSGGPGGSPSHKFNRVSLAGGPLARFGRHPDLTPYEQVNRVRYDDSWTSSLRCPQNPTTFELTTVRSAPHRTLLALEYQVNPYVFSGVNPHDFAPMPDEMLSGTMGVGVRINNGNNANLGYRLEPIACSLAPQEFSSTRGAVASARQLTAEDFTRVSAGNYATAAGFGQALMPPWGRMYGPSSQESWFEAIDEEAQMVFTGVIYYPMSSIVPFIQCRVSGYLCPKDLAKQMIAELRDSVR